MDDRWADETDEERERRKWGLLGPPSRTRTIGLWIWGGIGVLLVIQLAISVWTLANGGTPSPPQKETAVLMLGLAWNLFSSGLGVALVVLGRRDRNRAAIAAGAALFLGGFAPWLSLLRF